jgi:hypothetical protein
VSHRVVRRRSAAGCTSCATCCPCRTQRTQARGHLHRHHLRPARQGPVAQGHRSEAGECAQIGRVHGRRRGGPPGLPGLSISALGEPTRSSGPNGEIKWRANVVGIFAIEEAIPRLVRETLMEQNDEWAVQRACALQDTGNHRLHEQHADRHAHRSGNVTDPPPSPGTGKAISFIHHARGHDHRRRSGGGSRSINATGTARRPRQRRMGQRQPASWNRPAIPRGEWYFTPPRVLPNYHFDRPVPAPPLKAHVDLFASVRR